MRIPEQTTAPGVLPEGDYRARLGAAEALVSKAGNPMVKVTWQITSPPDHRGAEVPEWVVFTERGFWKVDIVAKAMGVKLAAGKDMEPDEFATLLFEASRKGREVILRIVHETDAEWGTRAKVAKTLKLTDAQTKDVEPDLPVDEPEPEPAGGGGAVALRPYSEIEAQAERATQWRTVPEWSP